MMHRKTILAAVMFAVSAFFCFSAAADMAIFPNRPVFTDRDRSRHVNIINQSTDPAKFEMSWFYQKQKPVGGYDPLETAPDPKYDVAKMVRFSPRQVHLEPGAIQMVRLSLRRPADLPEGEYRAYLKLTRTSPGIKSKQRAQSPGTKKKITANLIVAVGYGVPVIVRHGKYNATAKIESVHVVPANPAAKTEPALVINLSRAGKHSTLGVIKVFWTPPGADERQVGTMGNVNIFTEITTRSLSVPLNEPNISSGTLRVVYEGDGTERGITFDERTFPVTP